MCSVEPRTASDGLDRLNDAHGLDGGDGDHRLDLLDARDGLNRLDEDGEGGGGAPVHRFADKVGQLEVGDVGGEAG